MMDLLARKHFERGRQFELQDRIDEAVDAYERACALEPTFADPYLALGRIHGTRGQFQSALEMLDQAVERSDDPQIREWRGYVLGRLRRYEDALRDYRAVAEAGEPGVLVNLGRMLLALNRYDEAEGTLKGTDDEAGQQLLRALPRYREFHGERMDDARTTRYLFGRTLVLGTLGDGGLRLVGHRYQLLTERHIAVTVRRLLWLNEEMRFGFEAVGGEGPMHGPLARAVAELCGLPYRAKPQPFERVLLCSAVVKGSAEAARIEKPWREARTRLLHFALGLVPDADPDENEPAIVGYVGRCAPFWYRVEHYSRLVQADGANPDGPWPGFEVGPAYVDPNGDRVVARLIEACRTDEADPLAEVVFAWYQRHDQVRAY
ncbi:MAG: tetratricopeptide repeat protein, partial [Myxococcales bacterium]|nr:tetratricopeptide repeat protein [Myxococcales bacterium]